MHAEIGRLAKCDTDFIYDATSENCECATGTVENRDGTMCVSQCGENERIVNGRCACVEGAKIGLYDDGTQKCLSSGPCKDSDLKLSKDDSNLCVQSCELWKKDKKKKENMCVDKCPHWWVKKKNGFCKEEKWRLIVAAVVPSLIGVLLVLGCIGAAAGL